MIIDTLDNWRFYPFGPAWQTAFEFLASLTPGTANGEYPLQDEQIFARVMSYPTQLPETAVLEAHRRYIDIQTTLVGAEGIEWFPAPSLAIKTAYDPANDVVLYHRPGPAPARVDVFPGTFVLLFPHDAHMPGLMVGGKAEEIKKVVVKVAVDLLSTKRV
jgi:YhcH/YjgK/YiaL family protein